MAGGKHTDDRHKADQEDVAAQVSVTDALTAVSNLFDGTFLGGGSLRRGRSDFESFELNSMLDLVHQTKPEDLESAGKALWDARDAIKAAADELSGHIDRVEWVGESGDAFRKWGKTLVTNTHKLSTFAEVAGDQITAAGTGLASVISALPPRDTRTDPKSVADIPESKRVESNDEYAAALKTEKHRQEAINQMNRLSSFYAVSRDTLAAQEPPTFESMPDVGVPKPDYSTGPGTDTGRAAGDGQHGGVLSAVSESGATSHHSTDSRSGDTTPPRKDVDGSITYPDRNVGTEIDSVETLSPQTATPPTTGTPPSTQGTLGPGTGGGSTPPYANGAVNPVKAGPAGRTSGFSGGSRTPLQAQGRSGTQGGTSQAPMGRGPMSPMGRAAATGQGGARGGPTTVGRAPLGRGVIGGTPRLSGPAGGRTAGLGATGAGRGNGVVGGRPTTGPSAGATGPKVQRGTVVGGEAASGSRAAGGTIGQRGVIGAPNSTSGAGGTGQLSRRSVGNSDGVVGAPKGRVSGTRNNGLTPGGTGLVRGPGGSNNQQAPDQRGARGAQRPDSRGTNDETDLPDQQRRNRPPATD
ncbi:MULTISPECIES: hypothetical protein [Streptomyces]|uniref:hypothetical protein n=1 Tax=Streptomyces TaxID=1883 RepID=UPI000C61CE2E|nr:MULTISPECIES: hypothetical protein [Streptomyces]PIB07128.1 hypothetical protein B1C81_20610 [Streptomyces sp. HG99]